MDKITTPEMEVTLASYFDYRVNLIVPNAHWGMGNMHECDLLIMSQSGYLTEVEIKVSKPDLKADAKKVHGHRSTRIKRLFFALPHYLEDAIEFVPERAGIIIVSPKDDHSWGPRCKVIRKPVTNKVAQKVSAEERYKIARLGAIRIWKLKRKLNGT